MAGLLFGKRPFIHASRKWDDLLEIGETLGLQGLTAMIDKYEIDPIPEARKRIGDIRRKEKADWKRMFKAYRPETPFDGEVEAAVDLVDKLLQYDPESRLTAREALDHRFFKG